MAVLIKDESAVTEWAKQTIGLADVQVQVRLRGNHLHILCESSQSPPEKTIVSLFSSALSQTNLASLLPQQQPAIYKVFLCGRRQGAKRPDWTVKLEYTELQFQAVAEPETPSLQQPVSSSGQGPLSKLTGLFRKPQSSEQDNFSSIQETPERPVSVEPEPELVSRKPSRSRTEAELIQPFSLMADEETENHPQPKLNFPTQEQRTQPIEIDPLPKPNFRQLQSTTQESEAHPLSNTRSRFQEQTTQEPEVAPSGSSAAPLTVSTESLARQGYPDAIASYLSEILGGLGVGVKVTIRSKPTKAKKTDTKTKGETTERRLWVLCESAYSPDPSLLAQPIAERLRLLQLEEFRDACILLQVQGEPTPDWMLRIDLTPPDKILKEWGRWGDEQAIARLLNEKLNQIEVQVRATLKEATLHLFCHRNQPFSSGKSRQRPVPEKQAVMEIITPMLDLLAPQGICAATVYGLTTATTDSDPGTPAWIDWLNLPGAQHPELQPTALVLAQHGNLSALRFILTRLINPDLDIKLATGGIRVLLLQKEELLHVLTEAPTCPSQSQVAPIIAQFLRHHWITGIAGVRIYGRRAGQKLPLWRYGVHFKTSQPTSTPADLPADLVAPTGGSEAMIASPGGSLVLHPHLTSEVMDGELSLEGSRFPDWQHFLEGSLYSFQQRLIATHLFIYREAMLVPMQALGLRRYQKTGMALLWSLLGCGLVIQTDQLLGQWVGKNASLALQQTRSNGSPLASVSGKSSEVVSLASEVTTGTNPSQNNEVFNTSNFISGGSKPENCSLSNSKLGLEACKLAEFLYPTFRSPQLDEQLARFQHYILMEKQPPDILVIGSSRALRGVDPAVLEAQLAKQGYAGLKVYNFGVNGATLQVVDLIIRQILPPEQLPKLIILADGVRALNSGRVDRTYEAIATSEGYQQIAQGTFKINPEPLQEPTQFDFQRSINELTELFKQGELTFEAFQTWLNKQVASGSDSYLQRDNFKVILQSWVKGTPLTDSSELPVDEAEPSNSEDIEASKFQRNGFLPISIQFNPEDYYQNHAQVSGYYDGDYQGFELEGKQAKALKNLIQYAQSNHVKVVFVNMPLTDDYLDPVRTAYEEKFIDQMGKITEETDLIFIDLAQEWMQNYDYFSDPSHLNQYGAIAVSNRLVEESSIPWPKKK